MSFESLSHSAHQDWYEKKHPSETDRIQTIKNIQAQNDGNNINSWIHKRMFSLADVLSKPNTSWLTVGDAYGFDGNYIKKRGCSVVASDIAPTFLPLSKQEGIIDNFSIENVEKLSFDDGSFDYAMCKESYHHFPRPYLAIYEMLRVVKQGIIIIEPHDPVSRMPLLLGIRNILDSINSELLQKFWKNRYSFETVGNYVFKLSEREIEKIAMGMNLPAVAFKGINNNYYKPGTALDSLSSSAFKRIKIKLLMDNIFSTLGLIPFHVLSAIIFKSQPTLETISELKNQGYTYYQFPKNPYLK